MLEPDVEVPEGVRLCIDWCKQEYEVRIMGETVSFGNAQHVPKDCTIFVEYPESLESKAVRIAAWLSSMGFTRVVMQLLD